MTALICGSIAFDTVMVFPGRFRDHILPDRIHLLNVSFLVPSLRRNYGGCAGNIAYNLALLGGAGMPMATVGHDFAPYAEWLRERSVDLTHVREVEGEYTAQAFITTDLDDNQITAFHPGAMSHAHLNRVPGDEGITLGVVAPDGRDGMVQHAAQFAAAGIPLLFDPGQGLPMFDATELDTFLDQATYAVLNDYEAQLVVDKTGRTIETLARKVSALIVTRGGHGSDIFVGGRALHIPVARTRRVVDPTGCGDAYRAGLLYGLANGMDWQATGRLAAVMGALKIEQSGAQNHAASREEIADRFGESFGFRPW